MKLTRHVAAALTVLAIGGGAYFAWQGLALGRRRRPTWPIPCSTARQTHLQALRGKVVLVNFWATSCTTCVHEMPQIIATHEQFKARGYETLAVAMSYDPPAYVANFAESRKLPFGVAIDNTGSVAKSFGDVRLTPTSYLINKRGEIVKRYVGEPDFAALHVLVEKLLAET